MDHQNFGAQVRKCNEKRFKFGGRLIRGENVFWGSFTPGHLDISSPMTGPLAAIFNKFPKRANEKGLSRFISS